MHHPRRSYPGWRFIAIRHSIVVGGLRELCPRHRGGRMHASVQVRPGRRGRSTHRMARWSIALGAILALGLAPIVAAAPPAPSAGSITVDGATSDWSLGADRFADLTHGGVAGRTVVGHLYLRYDCETETL